MIYKIEVGLYDYLRTLFFSLSAWLPWLFITDFNKKITLVFLPIIITLYFILKLESIEFYEKSIKIKKTILLFNYAIVTFNIEGLKQVRIYKSKSQFYYGDIIDFNFWKQNSEDRTVWLHKRNIDLNLIKKHFLSKNIDFVLEE